MTDILKMTRLKKRAV